MLGLKGKFFDVLIWIVEHHLYTTPIKAVLDDEDRLRFFRTVWDIPGFREICIERETRLVHALAKEDDPVKRAQMRGQRVENMLWFEKSKKAFDKEVSLRKGADKAGSSPKR